VSAGCEAGITSFAVSENSVSLRAKYLSSMGKGKCEEGDCLYIAPSSAKQWIRSLSGEPNNSQNNSRAQAVSGAEFTEECACKDARSSGS
jgi:hypothetical protein